MASYDYVTKEGYEKLQNELYRLKTVERAKASAAIAEARDKGDLSENAEYDAAKDHQGLLELRISELSIQVANARILDPSVLDLSKVAILTKVRIKNLTTNKEMTYQIVSESESDLRAKKISLTSPIGKGLLGKKVGEIAEAQTPRGVLKFEILEITI